MSDQPRANNAVFRFFKRLLCLQVAAVPLGGAPTIPITSEQIPLNTETPAGLRRIHVASSNAEADLLRQVLADAGFQTEPVPSSNRAIFGTEGNPAIFVTEDQADAAAAFLRDYLNSPAPPEEEA